MGIEYDITTNKPPDRMTIKMDRQPSTWYMAEIVVTLPRSYGQVQRHKIPCFAETWGKPRVDFDQERRNWIRSNWINEQNVCIYIYIEKEYVPSSPMIAIGIIKPPLRYWPPFGSLEPRVFRGWRWVSRKWRIYLQQKSRTCVVINTFWFVVHYSVSFDFGLIVKFL